VERLCRSCGPARHPPQRHYEVRARPIAAFLVRAKGSEKAAFACESDRAKLLPATASK